MSSMTSFQFGGARSDSLKLQNKRPLDKIISKEQLEGKDTRMLRSIGSVQASQNHISLY